VLKKIFVYKHIMNFLIKAIAIATVISLMPLVTSVVVPEYAGFNLEAADDKKKKKRTRVKLPSKKAQKILQTVQPFLEEELWIELDSQIVRHTISWQWVKGHAGNIHNEQADYLARKFIEEKKLQHSN